MELAGISTARCIDWARMHLPGFAVNINLAIGTSIMSKKARQTEIFRCPVCNFKLALGPATLSRHLRISHGREVSPDDVAAMITELQSNIPTGSKKLPKLEFITRRPCFVGEWGGCDLCGQSSTRRWLFEKTTRGEIIVCGTCRERMTHSSKSEALDSWARLPGSYGG